MNQETVLTFSLLTIFGTVARLALSRPNAQNMRVQK